MTLSTQAEKLTQTQTQKTQVKARIEKNVLFIEISLLPEKRLSSEKKNFLVATSSGYQVSDIKIDNLPIEISINAMIPNLNYSLDPEVIEKIKQKAVKKEMDKLEKRKAKFASQGVTLSQIK